MPHGYSMAIPDIELSMSVSWGTDMEPMYFVLETLCKLWESPSFRILVHINTVSNFESWVSWFKTLPSPLSQTISMGSNSMGLSTLENRRQVLYI